MSTPKKRPLIIEKKITETKKCLVLGTNYQYLKRERRLVLGGNF
jgi:hypothetical protein